MQNAGHDVTGWMNVTQCHKCWMNYEQESKLLGENINNLRYTDDTTLIAESEEQLKNLLMRMKEESKKAGLNINIQKPKIMASGPITSWQIEGKKWKQ